jgi:hypothetical protein
LNEKIYSDSQDKRIKIKWILKLVNIKYQK